MSFLGHLLDRSTEAATGVEPRQRSVFETWSTDAVAPVALVEGDVGTAPRVRSDEKPAGGETVQPTPRAARDDAAHAVGLERPERRAPGRSLGPAPAGREPSGRTVGPEASDAGRASRSSARGEDGPPPGSAAPPSLTPRRENRPDDADRDGRTDAPVPTLGPAPGTPEPGDALRRPPTTGRDPAGFAATGRGEDSPAEPRPATPATDEPTLRPRTAAETDRPARPAPPDEDPRDDALARDAPRTAMGDPAPVPTPAPPPPVVEGIRPRMAPSDEDPRGGAPAQDGPRTGAGESARVSTVARPPAVVEGIRPRVAPSDEDPRGGADAAAAGPPPIHVSIGRIEVRAVRPEPTPRPPRERPAPMVSLDEYLENGGIPA